MAYKLHFISLGCAKNMVNCEQMMALCRDAGMELCPSPEGCDAAVVNTCGFLSSANEEAIENILAMAELKKAGKLKKILVTGCMTQRYQGEVAKELPEVDGILGPRTRASLACDTDALIRAVIQARRIFYEELARDDPSQAVFLEGWLNRADALEKFLLESK